jgi:hypothetical protein
MQPAQLGPIASQATSDQVLRVLARPWALTLPFNSQDIGTDLALAGTLARTTGTNAVGSSFI